MQKLPTHVAAARRFAEELLNLGFHYEIVPNEICARRDGTRVIILPIPAMGNRNKRVPLGDETEFVVFRASGHYELRADDISCSRAALHQAAKRALATIK